MPALNLKQLPVLSHNLIIAKSTELRPVVLANSSCHPLFKHVMRAVYFLHLLCSPETPKRHLTRGTESIPAFGVAMTFQKPAAECAGSGGHLSPVSF